jgi:undecaprenyl-diphosphatase
MPLVLIGLALGWAVMLLFGGMQLDRALMILLYAGDHPALARAAILLTELGSFALLGPITALAALWLLWRKEWRSAALLLGVTLSGRLLVEAQKGWIGRLRPEDQHHLVAVQSYSFPSGHAANATLVWICLALLLPRTPTARALAMWGAVLLALGIGLTRPILGVHWPSDVIAGWTLGLFWIVLLFRLAGRPLGEPVTPS